MIINMLSTDKQEKKIYAEILRVYNTKEKLLMGNVLKEGFYEGLNEAKSKGGLWDSEIVANVAFKPDHDPGVAGQHAKAIGWLSGIIEYFDYASDIPTLKKMINTIKTASDLLDTVGFNTNVLRDLLVISYSRIQTTFKSKQLINSAENTKNELYEILRN